MARPVEAANSEQALRQMLEGPALSPPAGVISNFHDPPNLDAFVALTLGLCIGFVTLAVVLRMYTKVFILRALAWEDCGFLIRYPIISAAATLLISFRCYRPGMGKVTSESRPVPVLISVDT